MLAVDVDEASTCEPVRLSRKLGPPWEPFPTLCLPVYCTASIYRLNIAHCWGVGGVQVQKYAIALPKHHIWIASQHHTLLPFTPMLALEFFLQRRKYFFVDQILSCAVRMEPD